ADRLAQRRAGDAELAGEHALRRESLAGGELSLEDQTAQTVDRLLRGVSPGGRRRAHARTISSAVATARSRSSTTAASEYQAACGVRTTFSSRLSGWSGGGGSLARTSRPAPPRRPPASAATRASSSTRPPRAALRT